MNERMANWEFHFDNSRCFTTRKSAVRDAHVRLIERLTSTGCGNREDVKASMTSCDFV